MCAALFEVWPVALLQLGLELSLKARLAQIWLYTADTLGTGQYGFRRSLGEPAVAGKLEADFFKSSATFPLAPVVSADRSAGTLWVGQ